MIENFFEKLKIVEPDQELLKTDSAQWVNDTVVPFGLENLHPKLLENLFIDKEDYVSIELPHHLIMDLLNNVENEELKNFEQQLIQRTKHLGDKLFVKLSSRSPKDFLFNDLTTLEFDTITSDKILDALCASERTFDDLVKFSHAQVSPMIHVMMFKELDRNSEFRGFFVDGKLMALSRYWYNIKPTSYKNVSSIISLSEKIEHFLPLPNCVVDFYLNDVYGIAYIVELNPMGLSDPCLFNYEEIADLKELQIRM